MSDGEERTFEELPLPSSVAPGSLPDGDDATIIDSNMLDPVALAAEATILRPSSSASVAPVPVARAPSSEMLIGDLVGTGAWLMSGLERNEERTMLARPPPALEVSGGRGASLEGVGELFAGYRLLGPIGTGGMAEIHLAIDDRGDMPRWCVVKRIRDKFLGDKMYTEMFREECRIGGLLRHPHVVQMIGSGDVRGVPFLALELVDGMSASGLLRIAGKTLPAAVIIEIALPIARALDHAHTLAGPDGRHLALVHRDVSPENILIGKGGAVKLADFGIARFEGRDHETAVGKVKGKIMYMAPEQLRLEPADPRSDMFSMGVVLTELLSGRVIFPNSAALIEDAAPHVKAALRARDDVPPALLQVVLAMLRHKRPERPATMSVIVSHLEQIRDQVGQSQEAKAYLRQALEQVPQPEELAAARGPDGPDPALRARLKAVMGELGSENAYPTSFGLMYSAFSKGAQVPLAPEPDLLQPAAVDPVVIDPAVGQRSSIEPARQPRSRPPPPPAATNVPGSPPPDFHEHGLRLTPARPGSVPPTMGGPRSPTPANLGALGYRPSSAPPPDPAMSPSSAPPPYAAPAPAPGLYPSSVPPPDPAISPSSAPPPYAAPAPAPGLYPSSVPPPGSSGSNPAIAPGPGSGSNPAIPPTAPLPPVAIQPIQPIQPPVSGVPPVAIAPPASVSAPPPPKHSALLSVLVAAGLISILVLIGFVFLQLAA